jgi:Fic family protein
LILVDKWYFVEMRIPQRPPNLKELIAGEMDLLEKLASVPIVSPREDYLHWDELRFRTPPEGWNHKAWWLGMKLGRAGIAQSLPLRDKAGKAFQFHIPGGVAKLLHEIDTEAGAGESLSSSPLRDRYQVDSLMREAITSSQLEGAVTTREVAKEMIRTGRKPMDRSERMILNNFATMQEILEWKDRPLTEEMVLHIHGKITEGALEKTDACGRYRRADEAVSVQDEQGEIFHLPPDAGELQERMRAMCAFANGETPGAFIHPVVRGILLHLWLAYDHPFVDGNGRTARALFYWSMLRAGYWIFEFVSISEILNRSPSKYYRAFLHTETDDNDATYFLVQQAEVIRESITRLRERVEQKTREIESIARRLSRLQNLNPRQIAVLDHAARHPGRLYTIEAHQRSHNTAYDTARRDLLDLEAKGLLQKSKRGKAMVFTAHPDLISKIEENPK